MQQMVDPPGTSVPGIGTGVAQVAFSDCALYTLDVPLGQLRLRPTDQFEKADNQICRDHPVLRSSSLIVRVSTEAATDVTVVALRRAYRRSSW